MTKLSGLDCLIYWLKCIRAGEEPKIPYHMHDLVRLFHNNLGTEESILLLEKLNKCYEEVNNPDPS